jgi:hypothetical protein
MTFYVTRTYKMHISKYIYICMLALKYLRDVT